MIANTMRAARPRLTRRRVSSTRRPTRQALVGTKCQLKIRLSSTVLDLTTSGRLSIRPHDALTRWIRRLEGHGTSRKAVTENVAHIVPDLVDVEVVREDRLADVWLENT
jgi:hypothetical protein